MVDFRDAAVNGMLLDMALDDMGVYPKSVSGGDKPYKRRTKYMEGWNAYGTNLLDKWSRASEWVEALPDEVRTDIEDLLVDEKLRLSIRKDGVHLWVLCNDLFFWAHADGEDFDISDLPDFKKALEESPKNGDLLWCCRKRGMRPQNPYYKYFSDEEKALFDATGPERDE